MLIFPHAWYMPTRRQRKRKKADENKIKLMEHTGGKLSTYSTSADELFWKNDFLDYCDDSTTVLTTSGIQSGLNLDF